MAAGSPSANLQLALQMNVQMLDAARAGDWARVHALQPQCDALLERDRPASASDLEALQALLQCHRALLELAGAERDVVGQQLGRQQRTHQALSAYLVAGHGEDQAR